jgi:hypothetical protein
LDYARIFKFAHFARTKKLALEGVHEDFTEEHAGEVALPGTYVTLYVQEVPSHILSNFKLSLTLNFSFR